MQPVTRKFRGDVAFAERKKLNHITRTARDSSPTRIEAVGSHLRQAVDPRWDPYSGEITSSDKGKLQSVKPKTFGVSLRSGGEKKLGNGNVASPTPLGERIRNLNSKASLEKLDVKTPISTTSGLSPASSKLANLPQDHLIDSRENSGKITPLKLAPDNKSQISTTQINEVKSNHKPVEIIDTKIVDTASVREKSNDKNAGRSAGRYRTTPKTDKISKKPVHADVIQPSANNPLSDAKQEKIMPSPAIEPTNHESITHPSPSIIPDNTSKRTHIPKLEDANNNTTETSYLTSHSSDEILYELPIRNNTSVHQESLIMNRVRPKVIASHFNRINRKALPPDGPVFISMSNSSALSAKNSHFAAKNLSQTPGNDAPNGLVTALQAHLDGLASRRRKISQSIRQMTELMPRDNLLDTQEVCLKREQEKKRIAMLLEEEAEIKREEHDVGLRLHRAWKRTESGAVYEPSSLWARRVTG